jgi:hypothetical protein
MAICYHMVNIVTTKQGTFNTKPKEHSLVRKRPDFFLFLKLSRHCHILLAGRGSPHYGRPWREVTRLFSHRNKFAN